jgi:hypothetical protein
MPRHLILRSDQNLPTHTPLVGWRAFLNKWLRIPFTRGRVVLVGPRNYLTTHPDNLQIVRKGLETIGYSIEIGQPVLQVMTGKDLK